jgi:hypothetical protein
MRGVREIFISVGVIDAGIASLHLLTPENSQTGSLYFSAKSGCPSEQELAAQRTRKEDLCFMSVMSSELQSRRRTEG